MKQAFLADTGGAVPTPGTSFGNPQPGIPGVQAATKIGPHWFYMITQEILNVLAAASLTPDANNYVQLAAAINVLINAAVGGITNGTPGNPGWFQIGSFTIQWGTHTNSVDDESVSFPHTFSGHCRGVLVGVVGANASSNVNVQASAWTTSAFMLHAQLQERNTFWIAIGD